MSNGDRLPACRLPFVLGLERYRLELAVLFEQDLYFSFCLLQLLTTRRGKLHAFFEQGQGLFQGRVALLQFLDNLFQK